MNIQNFRSKIVQSCVKNIQEFGYQYCTPENIFTDEIYKEVFKNILKENLNKHPVLDDEINSLLKEII